MNNLAFQILSDSIADEVARLLPTFLQIPEDYKTANGNCVLCVMSATGHSYTRMFGENPLRQRQVAQTAFKKALQVWITGYSTGSYETLVYTGQVDEEKIGIARPELIGWYGGLEAKTNIGERFIIAFSGMRGAQDVSILRIAAENLKTFIVVE